MKPRKQYKDGEPCSHLGCLSHVTHPCEGCGRTGGQYPPTMKDKIIEILRRYKGGNVADYLIEAEFIPQIADEILALFEQFLFSDEFETYESTEAAHGYFESEPE